jgi:capsular exopolysaccharide synthesis family protein
MVTSAEPLDGKSLTAANLAVSIATGINDYVLLVDCDLRRPSLHRLFNLDNRAGIQEYLEGETSVAPFLTKTSLEKLTILPGYLPSTHPSELLCSNKMRDLVEELKTRYEDRFIIFDSPPGQFMAETSFLARMMDGVILVVRYGKTPAKRISETIENIGKERILGVVFNASLERQRDYRYYSRYYGSPRN